MAKRRTFRVALLVHGKPRPNRWTSAPSEAQAYRYACWLRDDIAAGEMLADGRGASVHPSGPSTSPGAGPIRMA